MAAMDEKIKLDVVRQLYWDSRVDGSNINVTVKEGVVVLSGAASSFLERKAAFFAALYTGGVVHVDDRLTVNRF